MNQAEKTTQLNELLSLEEIQDYLIDVTGLDTANEMDKIDAVNYIIDIDNTFEILEYYDKV